MTEKTRIMSGLQKYGTRAYKKSIESGTPTTILRGNKICQISNSGEVSVLHKLTKAKTKVTQRTYFIK